MSTRDVIFVLGMARSGSSALTRVLSLCGGTLPSSVLAPRSLNPTGFWEPIDATKLNYDFLQKHRSVLNSPPIHIPAQICCSEDDREAYIRDIRRFLTGCSPGSLLVIKCLGLTELKDLWSAAAQLEGFRVKAAIPFRHPREVFSSLSAARQSAPELTEDHAVARWLRENILAEYQSRDISRVFVEYSRLLGDWRGEITRISEALDVNLDVHHATVDSFLNANLYHHRRADPPGGFLGAWASQVYSIFSAAGLGTSVDLRALDTIRQEYCSSDYAFKMLKPDSYTKDPGKFREEMNQWPVWIAGENF